MLAVMKVSSAIIEVAPIIVFFGLSEDRIIKLQKLQVGCVAIHMVRNPVVDSINACSIAPLCGKCSSIFSKNFLMCALMVSAIFARSRLMSQPMTKNVVAHASGSVHGSFSTFVS